MIKLSEYDFASLCIFGPVKVLLVLTTSGIFGDRLYQAFECPRRGRLRLKDLSSRWEDGVEAGVFFRLRAITCEPFFVFLENSENVCFFGNEVETSTCASSAAIRKSFPSTWEEKVQIKTEIIGLFMSLYIKGIKHVNDIL